MIFTTYVLIDLFTDTAAILNKLDLRNIMGCPGGHEHVPFCIYERLSGHFFLEFDRNGKKTVVPCNDVIMILRKIH